jgi:hypothetical protein
MYVIRHCFICRLSDSTVSEEAGIDPTTVANMALTARRSNHSVRSHSELNSANHQNYKVLKYITKV